MAQSILYCEIKMSETRLERAKVSGERKLGDYCPGMRK
jgi:hypothetical protein